MTSSDSPLLSVIVPVYNTAAFLPRCMDSILRQTYRNLEIICVNDGSSDGSAVILDEYAAKDSRVKVIHQENAGVSVARNRGLDAATGEFVTFVDADDWLEPDSYEKAVPCMEDDVDVVHFGTNLDSWGETEEAGNLTQWFSRQASEGNQLMPVSYGVMNSNICNKLYRKRLIEQYEIRFPENVAYAEDLAFFHCYASVARRVFTLKAKLYHYVFRDGSAIDTILRNPRQGIDHLLAAEHVADFVATHQDAILPDRIWYGFFFHMYTQAKRFSSATDMSVLMEVAWRVARKMGALQWKNSWIIQDLYQYRYSNGFFYRFVQNREIYGLGRFVFISVTYQKDTKIYRIFGRRVCEKSIDAF